MSFRMKNSHLEDNSNNTRHSHPSTHDPDNEVHRIRKSIASRPSQLGKSDHDVTASDFVSTPSKGLQEVGVW